MGKQALQLSRNDLDAVVFDLDGVLTDTASLHEAAWKEMFDAFLCDRPDPLPEFTRADYLAYVDGRPRLEGVRAFLASRSIVLAEGATDDPPGTATVAGLARRKNELVRARLVRDAAPLRGAEALLAALRGAGIRVAVASSSANAEAVLDATGLARFVEVRVDGVVASRNDLPGKPDPAIFVEALRRLGVGAGRAALFEDAVAGVQAGRRAGFARVIGVGHDARVDALRAAGADVVVGDLSEVAVA
ncbi:beta-phosphoglucomutase family hydrolase [uncultured Jannaschia sp.]|uniref:HAD family hydrolase n=1 Tax=uncultured Jannaschia sp. TaxID=293347 RepID=UPI0026072CAB|nr:beta-phosphoglucomutase family hydrolase [uncultured Jannaschia sp.]